MAPPSIRPCRRASSSAAAAVHRSRVINSA
jgi:hypothetical protein